MYSQSVSVKKQREEASTVAVGGRIIKKLKYHTWPWSLESRYGCVRDSNANSSVLYIDDDCNSNVCCYWWRWWVGCKDSILCNVK